MTISSTTDRNDYTGNASTGTYAYGYKIFANTDLVATVRDTDGVETTLTLTTHYTVTGVGNVYRDWETDRKSTRLNSSHSAKSRMPSSA